MTTIASVLHIHRGRDAPPPRVPSPWHRSPSYSPSVLPAASYDAPASFPSWTRPAPISPRLDALSAAVQLALYRALELSADDADACVARSVLRTHPGPPFYLLPVAPLTDTLPYTLFENFLAVPARARITHCALPHFVGVPPAAHVVPPNAAPHLAVLDNSHGLAAATLYDGLRPAALFGALGSTRKELGLRLAPNVDIHEICVGFLPLQHLTLTKRYQVSLLPDVQALRTLRLWATLATASHFGHNPRWGRHYVASCLLRAFTDGLRVVGARKPI
ncbi:hypothetical protein EDB84DRAFT_1562348 [Lactarius hengduanensis]|nr:hypothetical protein EDB84DRAFT_1562348 [Lactarius hengduanensis]